MMKKQGSVLGGIFLITGSTIGAGMLALPVLSGLTGFFPSLGMLLFAWAFMTTTALLLVEINGWFKTQINIVSMAEKALGNFGKVVSWFLYIVLFYSLLVSYIAGSEKIFAGAIFSRFSFFSDVFGWMTTFLFVLVFGIIVYLGTKTVDIFNRFLMVGLILFYFAMLFLGASKLNFDLLTHVDFKYLIMPLPVLIISFGFHNMIPTLTAYLDNDLKKMRLTIIGGSIFVLLIYVFWQTLVLGIVPVDGQMGLMYSYKEGIEATQSLKQVLGSTWLGGFAQGFAIFAIVTSFLAQSLALMHFLADGLKIKPTQKNASWLIFVTLVPPTLFAISYPNVFFQALSFAGAFCAVILFGLFPALMAWVGRYKKQIQTDYHVWGGKPLLIFISLFSLFLVLNELARIFGINLLL